MVILAIKCLSMKEGTCLLNKRQIWGCIKAGDSLETSEKNLPHIFLFSLRAQLRSLKVPERYPLWAPLRWAPFPNYYSDGQRKCPNACCLQSKQPGREASRQLGGTQEQLQPTQDICVYCISFHCLSLTAKSQ